MGIEPHRDTGKRKRTYRRFYDKLVEKAVWRICTFFHFVCGKRLVPMILDNLDALAENQRLCRVITTETKAKLATLSRSTVERILGREHTHTGKPRAPYGVCSGKNAQKLCFFAFFLSKRAKPNKLLAPPPWLLYGSIERAAT
jgi:hypothetical protein